MSIKAIIQFLPYKIKEQAEETLYKNYITTCLQMLTKSAANFGGGSYMVKSYTDILKPQKVEKRTANEIIADMKKKMQNLK